MKSIIEQYIAIAITTSTWILITDYYDKSASYSDCGKVIIQGLLWPIVTGMRIYNLHVHKSQT